MTEMSNNGTLDDTAIAAAMQSSIEGVVHLVVDALEFDAGRELIDDEQLRVQTAVTSAILAATGGRSDE